jgi:hypothetical protein
VLDPLYADWYSADQALSWEEHVRYNKRGEYCGYNEGLRLGVYKYGHPVDVEAEMAKYDARLAPILRELEIEISVANNAIERARQNLGL